MPLISLARFTLQSRPFPVIWGDALGRLVFANEAMCRLSGYSRTELLSLDVSQLSPSFPGDRWQAVWHELQAGRIVESPLELETFSSGRVQAVICLRYFSASGPEYFGATIEPIKR